MTNTELLAKIKAEIERRYKEFDGKTGDIATASRLAYLDVISFLSTLESEKPMQEGLEEEIKRYIDEYYKEDCIVLIAHVARHFAKWQKEQDDRLVDIIYQQGIEKGKDDMNEQILKDSVEGDVFIANADYKEAIITIVVENTKLDYLETGDKVRIIVKEDE